MRALPSLASRRLRAAMKRGCSCWMSGGAMTTARKVENSRFCRSTVDVPMRLFGCQIMQRVVQRAHRKVNPLNKAPKICSISLPSVGRRSALLALWSTTLPARRRPARTLSGTPPWPSSTLPRSLKRSAEAPLNGWAVWASSARVLRRSTGVIRR